jgi:transcriptional regulator with XRE-family HTH domain
MGEHLDKFTEGFKAIIDKHLINLNYGAGNRKELARITHISAGQIADWLNGVRLPGRDRICEICYYLAVDYEKKRKEIKEKRIGPETLDGMLNEMLEAVGYSPAIGAQAHRDQIWTRLAGSDKRELTVAWVRYPPFAYTDATGQLRGVAIDIMERVAKLMGARVKWVEKQWSNAIDDLMSHDVEIVAPLLLELPSRMFQMAFSSAIPEVAIGISGLINRACQSHISSNGLCLNYVKGEAGEALCTMFAPDATALQEHNTFESAWQAIETAGRDEEGRVNCLVADHVICNELEATTRGALKTVESSMVGGAETVTLPIAAGVHLQEPQLLQVVNECLKILRATKWFDSYFAKGDGKKLMAILADTAPAAGPTETREPNKRAAPAARSSRTGRK